MMVTSTKVTLCHHTDVGILLASSSLDNVLHEGDAEYKYFVMHIKYQQISIKTKTWNYQKI